MSNDKQRAAMAAHLSDLAGIAFRTGDLTMGAVLARRAGQAGADGDENDYRWSLKIAEHTPDQIDAAVAAIERDEHPPTSLPARVATYKGKAEREAEARDGQGHRASFCDGEAKALGHVLSLLGVTP